MLRIISSITMEVNPVAYKGLWQRYPRVAQEAKDLI